MKTLSYAVLGCVILGGCAAEPEWGWRRADGQSARNDPALHAQFESDKSACLSEMQKSGLSGTTGMSGTSGSAYGVSGGIPPLRRQAAMDAIRDCMAQRGYNTVPVEVAESSSVR
jgi:hypothetical protein